MLNEARFLGDVQRLELRPGDTVVLTCDGRLSDETAKRLGHYVQSALKCEHPVLVLESGLKVGVLGTGGKVNGAAPAFAEFGPVAA